MVEERSGLFKMIIALGGISLLAALSLGFVYDFTKAPIAKAKLDKQVRAIEKVATAYNNDPLADQFILVETNEGFSLHPGGNFDEGIAYVVYPLKNEVSPTGFAIISQSTNGYSGLIEIMVGVDMEASIVGVTILTHKETPGLGSKIESGEFLNQFENQSLDTYTFTADKDGGDVDAISGATISTRAVSEAVKKALDIQKYLTNEKATIF